MGSGDRVVGARQRSDGELWWARHRPLSARPPVPEVGAGCLYRSNDWFDPVPARVLRVHWDEFGDVNLLGDDPWPWLTLDVPGQPYRVKTREARLDGSAGWLPVDYQRWPRPSHDHLFGWADR